MTPAPEFAFVTNERRRSRRSTANRGYGAGHRELRRRLVPIVAGGTVDCARCGERIASGQPWDLDHRDDRRGYLGPSHRHCNRATSTPRRQSRKW